jgi:hypothetical protein
MGQFPGEQWAHPAKFCSPKNFDLPLPSVPRGRFHRGMRLAQLHLGMKVVHPQYGEGEVKAINEYAAEVLFTSGRKPVEPESAGLVPAEAQMAIDGLNGSLKLFIEQTVDAAISRLGLEKPNTEVNELGNRWRGGRILLQPADPALQAKEVEIDVFFHKIVMMRNNLRVLEQKVNGSETLSSQEKFDWQQYVTRCYGSMTTFNILFKDKESYF